VSNRVAVADTHTAAQRASGSSFYTAMRIMPKAQRDGMYEIYSFCRKVDDIADSPGPRDKRLEQLKLWRSDIDAIYNGSAITRARGLAVPIKTFGLRREDFQAVIDGMDMDGYLAWHTDDVRFRFGNGPTTTGKEAIREGLSQFWGSIAGLRHEFVQVWDTDDASILEATTVYTRKDGSQVGIPVTTILRRRGDLVESILGRQTGRSINVKRPTVEIIGAGLGHRINNTAG